MSSQKVVKLFKGSFKNNPCKSNYFSSPKLLRMLIIFLRALHAHMFLRVGRFDVCLMCPVETFNAISGIKLSS